MQLVAVDGVLANASLRDRAYRELAQLSQASDRVDSGLAVGMLRRLWDADERVTRDMVVKEDLPGYIKRNGDSSTIIQTRDGEAFRAYYYPDRDGEVSTEYLDGKLWMLCKFKGGLNSSGTGFWFDNQMPEEARKLLNAALSKKFLSTQG